MNSLVIEPVGTSVIMELIAVRTTTIGQEQTGEESKCLEALDLTSSGERKTPE